MPSHHAKTFKDCFSGRGNGQCLSKHPRTGKRIRAAPDLASFNQRFKVSMVWQVLRPRMESASIC